MMCSWEARVYACVGVIESTENNSVFNGFSGDTLSFVCANLCVNLGVLKALFNVSVCVCKASVCRVLRARLCVSAQV